MNKNRDPYSTPPPKVLNEQPNTNTKKRKKQIWEGRGATQDGGILHKM